MTEQKRRFSDSLNMDPHNYGLVALTKIEGHEEICAIRYNQIDSSLSSIFSLFWKAAVTLIALQISAIGSLVWYVATHK